MARIETLPERLQYLRPFQEYLATLPKAEVGDSTDTTLLVKILRKRIKEMSYEEAKEQLSADLEELENHLSVVHRRDDKLGFIVGFLLIAAEMPDELLKPPVKHKEIEERLAMELPPGAKSSVDQYSLTVKWKRQRFHVLRLNMADDFTRENTLEKLAQTEPKLDGKPAVIVQFGKVVGHKSVSSDESLIVWKRVDYLLKIPGGCVRVVLDAHKLFDESEWDSYLATLRFIKPPRSKAKSPATARRAAS